jgi:hypothetical protein
MDFDPDGTRRRLDDLLEEATDASPGRPIDPGAPVTRARRAIRIRYALLTAAFVVLTIVLTAGAVVARDRLDGDDGDATGPTATGATGPTATGPTATGPAPVATITSGPDELTNEPDATFEFTIEPPADARCALNDGASEPCESPVQVTAEEGENTFTVRGVDGQGREGAPARYRWTLDTQAPTVRLTSVVLEYAQTIDGPACFVDSQSSSCTEPIGGLPPGQHTFGVSMPTELDLTWILSATPPTATFSPVGSTAAPSTSTIRLSFEQSEAGTPACTVEGIQIPCDQGALADTLTEDGTEPVTHAVEIVPIDQAGNRGTPLQFSWSFEADSGVD